MPAKVLYTKENLLPKIPVYSCLMSVEYISLFLSFLKYYLKHYFLICVFPWKIQY